MRLRTTMLVVGIGAIVAFTLGRPYLSAQQRGQNAVTIFRKLEA